MSFTKFKSNDLIDPTKVNANFYHVGQGNLLPAEGNDLANTTGSADIGGNSNKWRRIRIRDFPNSDIKGSVQLIAESVIAAGDTAVAITFANILSSLYSYYIIDAKITTLSEVSTGSINIGFLNSAGSFAPFDYVFFDMSEDVDGGIKTSVIGENMDTVLNLSIMRMQAVDFGTTADTALYPSYWVMGYLRTDVANVGSTITTSPWVSWQKDITYISIKLTTTNATFQSGTKISIYGVI
jgi:hypothetical protein